MPRKKRPSKRSPKSASKRKPGRPKGTGLTFSAEQRSLVEGCAGYGIPHDDICKLIINPQTNEPVSGTTLREHFRRELDRGHAVATTRVAGALFKNATDGANVTAQIFWMKTRARWREPPREHEQPEEQVSQTTEIDRYDAARRIALMFRLTATELRRKQPA